MLRRDYDIGSADGQSKASPLPGLTRHYPAQHALV
jgi:hypothetical protein